MSSGFAAWAGSALVKQPERFGRRAQHEGMGLLRAQPLDRMVDGLDAGRQHQVHRRGERRRRIEHDDARHDQAMAEAFLDAMPRVADAGEGVELGRRQRGRHGDHADGVGRRPDRLGGRRGAFLRLAGAIEVESLDGHRALPQRDQHHLRGVDHRAAADGDDEIGADFARELCAFDHAGPRRMGGDAGIDSDIAVAQIADDVGQQRALRHRSRGRDEHAFRAQPLGFGAQRRPRRLAVDDALDVLMAVNSAEHGRSLRRSEASARITT